MKKLLLISMLSLSALIQASPITDLLQNHADETVIRLIEEAPYNLFCEELTLTNNNGQYYIHAVLRHQTMGFLRLFTRTTNYIIDFSTANYMEAQFLHNHLSQFVNLTSLDQLLKKNNVSWQQRRFLTTQSSERTLVCEKIEQHNRHYLLGGKQKEIKAHFAERKTTFLNYITYFFLKKDFGGGSYKPFTINIKPKNDAEEALFLTFIERISYK